MRPDEFLQLLHARFYNDSILQNEFLLELTFWAVVLLLAGVLLKTKPSFFSKIENYGTCLARRRGLSCAVVIFSCLLLRVMVMPWVPIPEPVYHDEYSYLLQADTFASGKITNPTPAGWEHFETFHINMQPTYHGMYPPGQALFMAAAEALHIHPWWGVWLSVGLMCGAISWMLQGW